jgi:type II secretory pathway component PulJ
MRPKMNKRRGFTLIEGLFSLFIVALVLSGLAHTLAQAASVKKNTKHMDQAIEEYHTLFTMRSDVLSALTILEPGTGQTKETMELTRVNPMMTYEERKDPLNDPLDPFEAVEQVTVEYRIDAGLLKRFESIPSRTQTAERLIEAQKFEVTLESGAPSLLILNLSLQRARVVKKRTLKVAVNAL